jgi:hypothetical protein
MRIKFEFFSEALIALRKEISEHPMLCSIIQNSQIDMNNLGELIGVVAAFFGDEMDGMYTQKELERLTDKYYWKLKAMRSPLILPPGAGTIH